MEKSTNITKIATALGKFQASIKTISFDSNVSVETRTGSSYSFKYASLSKILEVIRPHLKDAGLSFSQLTEEGGAVTTLLMHDSGEYLQSTLKLPIDMTGGKNDAQRIGSAITYARRYALSAILGISTDEDDDGNAASGNLIKQKGDTSKPAPKQPGTNAAPADNRPWITEKQLEDTLKRLSAGELELCKSVEVSFRIRKAFKERLTKACEEAVTKYGPSVLKYEDRKHIIDQLQLCNDESEVETYIRGMEPDMQENIAVQALAEARKRKLKKAPKKA